MPYLAGLPAHPFLLSLILHWFLLGCFLNKSPPHELSSQGLLLENAPETDGVP